MLSETGTAEVLPNPESYTLEDLFELLRDRFKKALAEQTQMDADFEESDDSGSRHPSARFAPRGVKLSRVSRSYDKTQRAMVVMRIPEVDRAGFTSHEDETSELDELFKTKVSAYMSVPKDVDLSDEIIDACDSFVLRAITPTHDLIYDIGKHGVSEGGEAIDDRSIELSLKRLEELNVGDIISINQEQAEEINNLVKVLSLFDIVKFTRI